MSACRLSSSTAGAVERRHSVLCHSSSSSQAAPASSSRRPSKTSKPGSSGPSKGGSKGSTLPAASKPVEPLIQVAVNTTSTGVATAVLLRLQQLGHAEIWATSAANHFTAIAGVGMAAQQLHRQPLQQQQQGGDDHQQQQQLEGLAVTAVMTIHDQPVKDDQKRRLNKLELQVQPAQQMDPALLQAGQPGSISTNRTTSIADILGLMQQQLLEPEDSSSSRVKAGAVCVAEARGEQAVTRALKAALSLQAAAGQPLLLRPVAAKVVDIVAEKRGQEAVADGLLLLFSWA